MGKQGSEEAGTLDLHGAIGVTDLTTREVR